MSRFARPAAAVAAVLMALTLLAACGSSSSGGQTAHDAASSARARESSAMANPTVSADLTKLENELLAAFQKEIKAAPAHPFKAAQAAVHEVFPAGDTAKIEQYAVSTFTVTMVHSKDARRGWAAGVASYALAQGATASPGSASIPGTTPTAPATSTGSAP